MSDAVHAQKIKDAAHALRQAVNDAANAGLQVDIDAHAIQSLSIGRAKPVDLWSIEVSVARPL